MTRAEDRLYVCGWTGKKGPPEDCWYGLVQTAMVALGDPVDDHFLATAEEADAASIWRHASPQTAPPQPEQAPPAAQVPDGGLPDWTRSRPSPELRPPRPLAPSRPEGEEPPVFSPLSAAERDRRFQRGLLVHKLLQVLPDMPAARRRDAALRFLAGRGLTQENAAEIAAETLAVLDDPAFSALFGPGSRAEVAVVGRVGAAVISGQIDRLLVAADRVLIADYKTNRPAPESLAAVPPVYLRQMAAYRALLQQIYADRPVDCALLWTDGPRLLALPGGLLDGHAPGAETPSGA
jgi:ATP-dependent helicase/nuclease subunit A